MTTPSPKLWVISELYYPEETSTGYILTRIAEGLAERFKVEVLCGQPSYSARGQHAPVKENRNGVMIRRCPATTLNKDILFFRLINLVTITLSMFFNALWRLRRDDLILVVTNPPSLPFLVALAGWLRGARSVLLVHDVYPDILIAAGMLKRGSPGNQIGNWLNRWLYRSAARVVVLGRDMQVKVAAHLKPEQRQRVIVITNWADLDSIQPGLRDHNCLLKKTGLIGKFVVEYAGNIGYPNDIEGLLACARLLSRRDNIHFLLLGGGAKRAWVEQTIFKEDLRNVTLMSGRPRREQQNFLNACDVNVVSLVRGMVGVSVPSRIYNIMGAGKPIIAVAEERSELAIVVREERIGWVVPPHDPFRLASTIEEARADPEELIAMGRRARAAAEIKYRKEFVLEAYCRLFFNLFKNIV